jgi:hypothetical protein
MAILTGSKKQENVMEDELGNTGGYRAKRGLCIMILRGLRNL